MNFTAKKYSCIFLRASLSLSTQVLIANTKCAFYFLEEKNGNSPARRLCWGEIAFVVIEAALFQLNQNLYCLKIGYLAMPDEHCSPLKWQKLCCRPWRTHKNRVGKNNWVSCCSDLWGGKSEFFAWIFGAKIVVNFLQLHFTFYEQEGKVYIHKKWGSFLWLVCQFFACGGWCKYPSRVHGRFISGQLRCQKRVLCWKTSLAAWFANF